MHVFSPEDLSITQNNHWIIVILIYYFCKISFIFLRFGSENNIRHPNTILNLHQNSLIFVTNWFARSSLLPIHKNSFCLSESASAIWRTYPCQRNCSNTCLMLVCLMAIEASHGQDSRKCFRLEIIEIVIFTNICIKCLKGDLCNKFSTYQHNLFMYSSAIVCIIYYNNYNSYYHLWHRFHFLTINIECIKFNQKI